MGVAKHIRLFLVCTCIAPMVAGCARRPSAPPLEDSAVFRNQREGFRFSVPEGWKQRARGEVPSGKILSERMLAEYRCSNCSGTLMISVAEVPLSTSLSDHITKNTLTGEK